MTQQDSLRVLAVVLVSVILIGAGVAIAGMTPGISTAQLDSSTQSDSLRVISVSASGEVDASPDAAVIRLSVDSIANDPETARSEVAERASRMRESLIALGVSEDQIRTVSFNIYEDRYRSSPEGSSEETRYRARHAYEIELDDIDLVGTVIDTAVDNGATSVQNVQYTVSDETQRELRGQALQRAMTNARSNADVIADSGEVTITTMHSASTSDVQFPVYRVAAETAADGDSASTQLDPGPVTVTATVTVTYQIA